jgi:hypothetical protein
VIAECAYERPPIYWDAQTLKRVTWPSAACLENAEEPVAGIAEFYCQEKRESLLLKSTVWQK